MEAGFYRWMLWWIFLQGGQSEERQRRRIYKVFYGTGKKQLLRVQCLQRGEEGAPCSGSGVSVKAQNTRERTCHLILRY